MISILFPEPQFRIKMEGGKRYLFDTLRKRWLLLTEEEWVRQNFKAYLAAVMQYPAEMIAVEKEILVNGLKKRFDLLVYDRNHQPWMLVECKAPSVPLSEDVLQQALRYHLSVPASFIIISNGIGTIGWKKEGGALQLIEVLPSYESI